jgi:hypothetical protein
MANAHHHPRYRSSDIQMPKESNGAIFKGIAIQVGGTRELSKEQEKVCKAESLCL